jgi:anthranilate phosphoribosyltransferase
MTHASILRQLAGDGPQPRDLAEWEAEVLFATMLDGGLPELELGATLALLQQKGESVSERLGFARALAARVAPVGAPEGKALPVVFPSYGSARDEPDLLPLLALLLQRFQVPVLIHGTLDRDGSCAYVFRELGVMPCVSAEQATARLAETGLAFVPVGAIAPGLAGLMALSARLGVRNVAHSVARLLSPFEPDSLRVVGAVDRSDHASLRQHLQSSAERALLLDATAVEACASARRRPRMELFDGGLCSVLFEAEVESPRAASPLAAGREPQAAAAWTRAALAGQAPLPGPLVHQLACCLYGSGAAGSLHEAKALVAVGSGVPAA